MKYALIPLLFIIILIRYKISLPNYKMGDKVRITSKVSQEPIRYENSQYLNIQRLKIYLPLYPELNYGDRVVIEGVVGMKKLENPKLITQMMSENLLYDFRNRLIDFYKSTLPEPHSSLISGMVAGSKSEIPVSFWENLKKSGTAHVVVASGMNVSLVASFLTSVLLGLVSRKIVLLVSISAIWLYTLIVGLDAPIIRAAIMGTIAFSAQILGRLGNAKRALVISAVIMLLINPLWLEDLGFLLSFAATMSLMLFEAKVRKWFYFIPGIFREGLSTSISAQVGVAPILYFSFGNFNLLSPLINALVLWTVAPLTVIGMFSGIISIISIYLGKLILYLAYPLTTWFIWIIQILT